MFNVLNAHAGLAKKKRKEKKDIWHYFVFYFSQFR